MIPGVKPAETNDTGSETMEAETERNGGDRNYGIDELLKMQETV